MYYRRNADTAVRTAQRQYAAGQISAEALVATLRRANVPLEITNVFADKKTFHVNVDLLIGTPDSVFEPWGLDEKLVSLTLHILNNRDPNITSIIDDFTPVDRDYILSQVPEMLAILEQNHIERFLYKFSVNELDGHPHLTAHFSLLDLPTASVLEQTESALQNYQQLRKFFGNVELVIWLLGREAKERTLRQELLQKLGFSGYIKADLPLIQHLPYYPNFTLAGYTVSQLRDYCIAAVQNSPDIASLTQEQCQDLCPIPERRGPGRGSCIGIGVRKGAGLGDSYSGPSPSSLLDLFTFFFFIARNQVIGQLTGHNIQNRNIECILIQNGQVVDTAYEEEFRQTTAPVSPLHSPLLTEQEAWNLALDRTTTWLRTAASDLAVHHDASILEIIWLD